MLTQLGLTLRRAVGYDHEPVCYPATLTPDVQDGGPSSRLWISPKPLRKGTMSQRRYTTRRIALKKRWRDASDVGTTFPSPRLSRLGNMRWPCRPRRNQSGLVCGLASEAAHPGGTRRTVAVRRKRGPSLARPVTPRSCRVWKRHSPLRKQIVSGVHPSEGRKPGQPRHRRRPCGAFPKGKATTAVREAQVKNRWH